MSTEDWGVPDRFVLLDADGILEACRQTHPLWHQGRDFDAYAARILEALERMGTAMRYVGLMDPAGRLAASARELEGTLLVQGTRVPSMGIAAVFVRPDLRGNGLGKRLVRSLVQDARQRGFPLAFLFSDIDPGYYESLGFRAFPAVDWHAEVRNLPEDTTLAIRRAVSEDTNRMMQWYEASSAHASLAVCRTERWWRYFRWWRDAEEDYILCSGSDEVGYMNVRKRGDTLQVYEWAAPGIEPPRVWGAIRARAADCGAWTVGGWAVPARMEPWMVTAPRTEAIPMLARVSDRHDLPHPGDAAFEELDHF